MIAFNWFRERNDFNLRHAQDFLQKAETILDNAVGDVESSYADEAAKSAKKAVRSFTDALAAGDTEEGWKLEKEGLESIYQWATEFKLSEQARAYFA
ncbi:hypothetical protein [Rhizobium sp. Root482]|uniref:hypothetical protein n=1 Tax=Rhizobium sp. Root482 TaxID=1736543 RepID=UPI0006F83E98|nr:hypothetical protein [Rhizobium sp. Root482]KQY14408.1 hypothetical protein ASD31_09065 [Rhizobium sp. Root482]